MDAAPLRRAPPDVPPGRTDVNAVVALETVRQAELRSSEDGVVLARAAGQRVPLRAMVGVVLTPPEHADASTGSNARAIARLASVRVHTVPRTTDLEVCARSMREVLSWLDL